MRALAVAVLAILLAACGHRATCARPDACGARTVRGPCAGPSTARPPAHPARAECLAGEWAPSPADAPEVAGFAHSTGEGAAQHVLVRSGARPWTDAEIAAFRAAHERELFALGEVQGMGSGLYCGQGRADVLGIELRMCSARLADVAGWIRDHLAPAVPEEAEVVVCVTLIGMTGPRCDATDPACGPVPYSSTLEDIGYACDRDRHTIAWPTERGLARGACARDGECVVAGCGNHCVAWPEADFVATCEGYSDLEGYPALCGCVEGACTWFRM